MKVDFIFHSFIKYMGRSKHTVEARWSQINQLTSKHKTGLCDLILILEGLICTDGWVWSTTPSITNKKTNMDMCSGMPTKPLWLKNKTCSWHSKVPLVCSSRQSNKHLLRCHVVTRWQITTFKPVSTAMSPCCRSKVIHAVYVTTCLLPNAAIHAHVAATCILKVNTHTHTYTPLLL